MYNCITQSQTPVTITKDNIYINSPVYGTEFKKQLRQSRNINSNDLHTSPVMVTENFDDRTLLKDSRGRKHKAIAILVEFLKTLCDKSIKNLKTTYSNIHDVNDSKWVLMIPSVRAGSRAADFFEKAWSKDIGERGGNNKKKTYSLNVTATTEKCEG
ncbi:unnamed protein product [Mytilus coruscus]|uniref:Uncharacterized protein n=1 Tax=Mytilus coruscus TaxID=42192 RepID=A0A6J8E9M5_MYTCO|nr:unnamed protein product [Mytilus coruscus]